jgi:hypothetical protein
MTGLKHDFLLLSKAMYPYSIYSSMKLMDEGLYHSPKAIHLYDDLLYYMGDMLKWIPSHLPHRRMKKFKGLDYCGLTIINEDGAPIAHQVFQNWKLLLACGPERLKLTGPPTWRTEDPIGTMKWQKLVFDRDEVVSQLEQLTDALEQVRQGQGNQYILHLGL